MKTSTLKQFVTLGFISVAGLLFLANSVKSESVPEGAIAPESSIPAASEAPGSTDSLPEQANPGVSQNELVCPPGQFASAFSDVLPDHWAYTAVNRLASVPVECFDLPN